MKSAFKKITTVFLMLSVVAVFGCTTKPKIVGKWAEQGVAKASVIEFLSDQTVLVQDGPSTFSGKWSILDDGRLKVDLQTGFGNVVVVSAISFNGDELTMQEDGKKSDKSVLKRAKK